jgi:hypothetical protein
LLRVQMHLNALNHAQCHATPLISITCSRHYKHQGNVDAMHYYSSSI